MADEQINSALCSAFINLGLSARPGLMATHQGRFYQDVNVPEPTDRVYPYIYWHGKVRQTSQRSADRKKILKLTSIYHVRSVERYPHGGANWSDLDPAL